MIVSRILHAGYIFESAGVRIAFDPILETPFSTNCFPFPSCSFSLNEPLSFDAVFISHFHDDHCSLVSLSRLDRRTPIYLYSIYDELFEMIRALGFSRVEPLIVGSLVSVEGFCVTPRLALDPDIDTFFSIEAEGLRVLNVVDAWIDPTELERLVSAPWDLVLWPFQTMLELEALMPSRLGSASRELPPEWVEQIHALRARFVVPSSCQFRFEEWSWLNARYFPITYAEFARGFPSAVRMDPGASFALDASGFTAVGRLPWVGVEEGSLSSAAISDGQRPQSSVRDYVYDQNVAPTPVQEIAARFPLLAGNELADVVRFAARFPVRVWNSDGTSFGPGPTEISAYKLWRALNEGEQLTSLYLRTPDVDTDPLIAELSRDPLSFQRAQLRRLLSEQR